MLKAYINYPNPKVRAHLQTSCGAIQKMGKPGQRLVHINRQNISGELHNSVANNYPFAANAAANDMWVEIDFGGDYDFEVAVLAYVQRIIGKHYTPLANVKIETHC